MPVKAILFDFDDTLADEMDSFAVAIRAVSSHAIHEYYFNADRFVASVMEIARREWRLSPMWEFGRSRGQYVFKFFQVRMFGQDLEQRRSNRFGRGRCQLR